MVDLLELQKNFILSHLKAGDVAVDFTMGNGNDTLFLSETVGAAGRVFAFDLQEEALVSTRAHLQANGAPENYTLFCASHHRVKEFITEPFKAGMFNLGYLPSRRRLIFWPPTAFCSWRSIPGTPRAMPRAKWCRTISPRWIGTRSAVPSSASSTLPHPPSSLS